MGSLVIGVWYSYSAGSGDEGRLAATGAVELSSGLVGSAACWRFAAAEDGRVTWVTSHDGGCCITV